MFFAEPALATRHLLSLRASWPPLTFLGEANSTPLLCRRFGCSVCFSNLHFLTVIQLDVQVVRFWTQVNGCHIADPLSLLSGWIYTLSCLSKGVLCITRGEKYWLWNILMLWELLVTHGSLTQSQGGKFNQVGEMGPKSQRQPLVPLLGVSQGDQPTQLSHIFWGPMSGPCRFLIIDSAFMSLCEPRVVDSVGFLGPSGSYIPSSPSSTGFSDLHLHLLPAVAGGSLSLTIRLGINLRA